MCEAGCMYHTAYVGHRHTVVMKGIMGSGRHVCKSVRVQVQKKGGRGEVDPLLIE